MVSACQGRLSLIAIQCSGSDIGPHVRENKVLPGAPSPLIHQAQIVLSRCVSLLRRPSVPFQCCLVVLRDALSPGIHHSQIELCRCDALLRKGAEEPCCLGIVTTVIRKLRLLKRSRSCDIRPGHDQEDYKKKTPHRPVTFQRLNSITSLSRCRAVTV